MGNTVSAAERLASDIVHPHAHAHPVVAVAHSKGGVPPPECPMHQKDGAAAKPPAPAAAKDDITLTGECPLGHDKDVINPLNMVSVAMQWLTSGTMASYLRNEG